jgi:hypothetical protein
MSDALFLPRELFSSPAPTAPAERAVPPRRGVHFASGEAVAADLLQGLLPASPPPPASTERRRKPRVDLHLA